MAERFIISEGTISEKEPVLCTHGKCITEGQHKRKKKVRKCHAKIKKKSRWNKKLGRKEMSKKSSKEIELIDCD